MAARGPVEAAGTDEIASGAGLIRSLADLIQRGGGPDPRLRLDEAGTIDLQATAFLHGITPGELVDRLDKRRGQSKRTAYALFALGTIAFIGWVYGALRMPMSAARVISAIEFLPFCLLLFLLAFKASWTNWQLRTRRLGSAVAYLRTNDPFLPR